MLRLALIFENAENKISNSPPHAYIAIVSCLLFISFFGSRIQQMGDYEVAKRQCQRYQQTSGLTIVKFSAGIVIKESLKEDNEVAS